MVEYNDFPLGEVAMEAEERTKLTHGTAYQKWTCSHCGSRQTMDVPNTFYMSGICEECKKETKIEKCNYMLIMSGTAL